jgi:hypothetical protein
MTRHPTQRRRAALSAGLVLAVLSSAACSDDTSSSPARTPSGARSSVAERVLFYADGTMLHRLTLEDKKSELIAELPSADVAVSPNGQRYVAVVKAPLRGDSDELARPSLVMVPTAGPEAAITLGPGRSPLWSPDGSSIAAISEIGGYTICPVQNNRDKPRNKPQQGVTLEECVAGERVVVYEADGGPDQDSTTALGANRWSVLGWVDGDHILGLGGATPIVALGFPGASNEEIRKFGVEPAKMWGGSPTEQLFLIAQDEDMVFITGNGKIRAPVNLPQGGLSDGAWSPDGRMVAAELVRERANAGSLLTLIDARSGSVEIVPDSEGALGNVVWSEDSSAFAYVRIHPEGKGRTQTVLCSIDLECERLFDWKGGVDLLSLT